MSKHATSIDKKFPFNSEEWKISIETQELKLKQQWMFLKCSMTESQCITLASYKIAMQIAKYQKSFLEGEFLNNVLLKLL